MFFLPVPGQGQNFRLSHEPGTYSEPLRLEITGEFSKVYYATDGTPPRFFRSYSGALEINRTTAFLFRIVRSDGTDTIVPATYFIGFNSGFPLVSVQIRHSDLWSDSAGIYVRGPNAYYSDSAKKWLGANFDMPWEKEVYFEFFTSGERPVAQKCGLKIFGESTRQFGEKSMRLIARPKYGQKRFRYPFFDDKPADEYKHLILRTSGNDYRKTRFRDAMNSTLAATFNLDYQAFLPCQLFVNGEYWGVYNLREKINGHFFESNYNIPDDSVEIVMGRFIQEAGHWKKYMTLYRYCEHLDSLTEQGIEKVKSLLDVRNFARYKALQIFINNPDHRGNIRYWRRSDDTSRFKMIFYDTDHSWGYYQRNLLEKCLSAEMTDWYNPPWSTRYFRLLMQNKSFKTYFLNQCAYGLSTCWRTDSLIALVDRFERRFEDELPRDKKTLAPHIARVAVPDSTWRNEVEKLRFFAKKRPARFLQHLIDYFDLKLYELSIRGTGNVRINGNDPVPLPFTGTFFRGYELEIQAADQEFNGFDADTSRLIHVNGLTGNLEIEYRTTLPVAPQHQPSVATETAKTSGYDLLWNVLFYLFGLTTLFWSVWRVKS